MGEVTPGIVYVDDDDDQIADDEWLDSDIHEQDPALEHGGQIDVQVTMCMALLCLLVVLVLLIALLWLQYGAAIKRDGRPSSKSSSGSGGDVDKKSR